MPFLRASVTPTSFGEYHWESPDDVVEVDSATAAELLPIRDIGFEEVDAPKAKSSHHEGATKAKTSRRRAAVTEPDPDADPK